MKDELKNTSIQITCLDEDGNVLKRVTSGDSGDIEEDGGEHQSSENTENASGTENGGGSSSGGSGIVPGPSGNDQPSGN